MHKRTGKLSDDTLLCYLSLVQKGSKVFPEARRAGTLGTAHAVLKGKGGKAVLDRELLAAWLNWAHGVYDGSTKVKGATTLKRAVTAAEKHRLNPKATSAQVRGAAAYLSKNVNRAK
nr:hypothetical protein GCM10020093_057460 [Planobispora longispora]